MRIATYSLTLLALLMASASHAAVTSIDFVPVEEATVAGHKTFDLTVTGTGQFTGVQMYAELTAGAFYNNMFGSNTAPSAALIGAFPELAFDTFMGMGGATAETSSAPVIPGGAVNLGGASGLTFSNTKIDSTWAPPGASPVNDPSDYFVGRFTISEDAQGSIKLLGLTFQDENFLAPEVDVAALLEGGTGGGPGIFASTPDPGSVLDFGYGPDTRSLQLAVRNTAEAGSDDVVVAQAVITGADASLFSTPGFAQMNLVAGGPDQNISVQFNGIGTPGIYGATLELLDDGGASLGTYDLTARVPEPSTVALAGLGLVGLVGFMRRRG